jgi:hypothetical protein
MRTAWSIFEVYRTATDTAKGWVRNMAGPIPLLALVAAALCAAPGSASQLKVETIGYAYDLDSEQLLYSETHCVSDDALMREVAYRDSQNALIAFKALNYNAGPTLPEFMQNNINTSDSVKVELRQGDVVMTFADALTEAVRQETKKPDSQVPLVVDAGFDAFVKANWDDLLAGSSKAFQFPFAAREMLVDLKIAGAPCSYESESDQCFTLELDNWLLKVLADPIELGYDRAERRLTRFRGASNITDAEGEGMLVDIRYRYTDIGSVDCATE